MSYPAPHFPLSKDSLHPAGVGSLLVLPGFNWGRGAQGDGCLCLCLQSQLFSWGGGRMGTVPGRPPESCRPLAETMDSNTWHSPLP